MEEMGALLTEVKSEGAKLDLFLDVRAYMATGEVLTGKATDVELYVAYPTDDGEFMLMADITDEDNRTETKQIQTIDGMEPMDFFTEKSSTPPFYSAYKVS
jgi:hypothetical protein